MFIKTLLIGFSLMLALPNFISRDINEKLTYDQKERYYPSLSGINTIDKLENFVDQTADQRNIRAGDPAYPLLLSYIISCRFYHGFSHFRLDENWIASVGEYITGIGLSCKVQPTEIMKNEYAACSQQALIMMEILKRKKIDYRKVGFPHHYAIEVRCGDKWYFYDPNMEPRMNLQQRIHENWNGSNDSLKKYYDAAKHDNLSYQFGSGQNAKFRTINETPAARLRLFQSSTAVLSRILWIFPLVILFAKIRREKSCVKTTKQKYAHSIQGQVLPA